MTDKYRTINENDAIINPSVSTLFSRQKTIKKEDILKLNKYSVEHTKELLFNTMEISEDGEYVRLKDILDLFE